MTGYANTLSEKKKKRISSSWSLETVWLKEGDIFIIPKNLLESIFAGASLRDNFTVTCD